MRFKTFAAGALAAAVLVPSSFALAHRGEPVSKPDATASPEAKRDDRPEVTAAPIKPKPSDEPKRADEPKPSDRPESFEELKLRCGAKHDGEHVGVVCEWSQSELASFDSYRLWRSDGEHREVVLRTQDREHTRHLDRDVSHGHTYLYKVEVLNGGGHVKGASNVAKVAIDDRLEHLRLSCAGIIEGDASGIACKWTPSEHPRFGGYKLWRVSGPDARQVVFRTDDRERTRFLDREVRGGHVYAYMVEVLSVDGATIGWSNKAEAKAPAHDRFEELKLECVGREGGIVCEWTKSEHRGFAAYRLVRSDGDSRTVVFKTRDRSATRHFDGDVEPGTGYLYKVEVLNGDGKVIGASNIADARAPESPVHDEPTIT